ncbi:MAG TPA: hypothetical protein VM534_04115 [Thermoanaerobaculia bacterium]|nr:hypothetical protein [Thermoanaerobaculia bacterium]
MSVSEIGQLHTRYVQLADRFKTLWSYHQLASGVYLHLLELPLPYRLDFKEIYEPIRTVSEVIRNAAAQDAAGIMDRSERELDGVTAELLQADENLSASLMRRFFDRTRAQDEKIIFSLIKFYLYAGAVEGKRRDKLDFLFTRIAQVYIEERAEYTARDSLELRQQFQSLLSIRPRKFGSQDDVVNLIGTVRRMREQLEICQDFDQLVESGLLDRVRRLKHEVRDLYFHPDVLLAIVQCNVSAKNTFSRLYADEEGRIVDDARRLLENEPAIARGFGESNPELLDELARFKGFMKSFDDARAESNVKHSAIAQLKKSMNNILAQLDRDAGPGEEFPEEILHDAQRFDEVQRVFGPEPVLSEFLVRIVNALEEFDERFSVEQILHSPEVYDLRLEPWEVEAFIRVRREGAFPESDEDLALLFCRAAALRIKIDGEARELVEIPARTVPDPSLLERARASLDRSKELDNTFRDLMQDGAGADSTTIHHLYRSRLRLLRGFSGLWLIYDQCAAARK